MTRRTCLQTMATVAGAAGATRVHGQAATSGRAATAAPIVLHCDLIVDAAREQEMLRHFHGVFKPAAAKFQGYLDLKMLKLRTTIQGVAPARVNYRFQLTYQSEALRQKWVSSDVHKKVWDPIAATMLNAADFQVLLFDSV